MGLLDEAIREHLELKRRRGADATEVARQEQEAFGPARRGDVEAATATAEPEPALDAPGEFAAEEQTVLHVVPQPDPAAAAEAPVHHLHEHEEQHEPPRPHGDPADQLPHVEAAPVQEHRVVEPPAPPPAAPPAPERAPEPEPEPAPAPPRAEDEPAAPEGEDVLEEMPEFLQETPEHDRLWFEQRPPRDFDF